MAKNPAPSLPEVPRLLTAIKKNVGWESALLGWLYFYLFGNLLCILDTHPASLGLNLIFLKLGVGSKWGLIKQPSWQEIYNLVEGLKYLNPVIEQEFRSNWDAGGFFSAISQSNPCTTSLKGHSNAKRTSLPLEDLERLGIGNKLGHPSLKARAGFT